MHLDYVVLHEMILNVERFEIYKIGIFTNYINIRHDYNKHLDAL